MVQGTEKTFKVGYQKCQDPSATMPSFCNPGAVSNVRGPAAEGVAHKITTIPGSLKLRKEYIGHGPLETGLQKDASQPGGPLKGGRRIFQE